MVTLAAAGLISECGRYRELGRGLRARRFADFTNDFSRTRSLILPCARGRIDWRRGRHGPNLSRVCSLLAEMAGITRSVDTAHTCVGIDMHMESHSDLVAGANLTREIDALFVNAPLRDYSQRPRSTTSRCRLLGMPTCHLCSVAGSMSEYLMPKPTASGFRRLSKAGSTSWVRGGWVQLACADLRDQRSYRRRVGPSDQDYGWWHQAKAMPTEILTDPRMAGCRAWCG